MFVQMNVDRRIVEHKQNVDNCEFDYVRDYATNESQGNQLEYLGEDFDDWTIIVQQPIRQFR